MKFFKEKFYKIQNSGQGADNPSYDSNTDRKRLMWIQQFASKHKNYTKIFIGAYIVCSSDCRQSPHVKVWAFSCFWHFHNV